MNSLVTKDYEGLAVQFTGDGWFSATVVAKRFGKEPYEWLRLPDTERYIDALCKKSDTGKSRFILTNRGGNTAAKSKPGKSRTAPGTWLHPKLGVPFARWLDIDFAIWCDEQIDNLIRGEVDVKRARHQAAASFKVMTEILKLTREVRGKGSKPHHYSNEARLINWSLTGQFTAIDRDSLSNQELDLLAKLEERNACFIGAGLGYQVRKQALKEYVDTFNIALPLSI